MNLTPQKIQSILKGAAIAAAGAALTYAVQHVTGSDFGTLAPVATALLSILVNALHKIQQTDPAPTPTAEPQNSPNGQPKN